MNIKSERGQSALVFIGILALIGVAILMMVMVGNSRGMQAGANTIGYVVGNAIDNATAGDTFVAWKGPQTLYPNKHAIERHGTDAWATVDCYNCKGTFHIMADPDGNFNLLCWDDDGKVRDVIVKRRGNSNVFDFVNAYTPKDGVWKQIQYWLENTWHASKASMPNDAIIVIDGKMP